MKCNMHNCTDCTHKNELVYEVAGFVGRVSAILLAEQFKQRRPDLALKAKFLTWKQFRVLPSTIDIKS